MARYINGRRTGTYKQAEAMSHNEAYAKAQVKELNLASRANLDSSVGDNCNMPKCEGYLVSNADGYSCTCHCGNPPCATCTSGMHCSECDWEVEDA